MKCFVSFSKALGSKVVVLLLLLFSFKGFSQTITNLNISNSPTISGINVSLETHTYYYYYFHNYTYSIDNNIITLNVCYYTQDLINSSYNVLQNNFEIPLTIPSNYTLIVKIKGVFEVISPQDCDFTYPNETASMNFSFPLSQTVYYLSSYSFSNEKNLISLYPNPTNDEINISFKKNQKYVCITLRNILGQEVSRKYFSNIESILYPIKGENGLYIITIEDENNFKNLFRIYKK